MCFAACKTGGDRGDIGVRKLAIPMRRAWGRRLPAAQRRCRAVRVARTECTDHTGHERSRGHKSLLGRWRMLRRAVAQEGRRR